jgi:hypothetical protein
MDRRYREAAGAVDTGGGADRLIGQYLQKAAIENRRAATMGGSTGTPDWYTENQRAGLVSAQRSRELADRREVFEENRRRVWESDQAEREEEERAKRPIE